jgi:hypothetical protein
MMTAEEICKLSADVIGMSYPSDKDKMFFLCRMANHEIWKQGRYHGMIKEFYVNVREDGSGKKFIVTPNGHNVLLGINVNTKPTRIVNNWFQFHRNGIGSSQQGRDWNTTTAVIDMGESPVIEQPRIRHEIQLSKQDPVYIAVRSRGIEDDDSFLIVSGENRCGEDHYSFNPRQANEFIRTLSDPVSTTLQKISPTYGIEYKLTNKFTLYENIYWTKVAKISKSVTKNVVDVYAVYETGESHLLATLAPHQTNSTYRSYMLPMPDCQGHECVHGLFKTSEPEAIHYPSQQMVTENVTALMDMMIGMDYKYFKKDLNAASVYILSAVKALEDSTRENMSNHQTSIQVDETIYGTPQEFLTDYY